MCSENKGADQLRGYREADLRLCFRICRLFVFPWGGSFIDVMRLNENYLIYIFMNINVNNRGKMRKETIAIAKF